MSLESGLRRLGEQVKEMRALANLPEARLTACHDTTSRWCTAEHVDHMVKVSSSIVKVLSDGNARTIEKKLSPIGRAILLFGWIPRGKGQAPERLRGARVAPDALTRSIDDLERLVANFPTSDVERRAGERLVPHPRFGGLTPVQAVRFAAIHNAHHFKIVRDVLARL